jgi:Flp pilus assembly protein TadG
MSILRDEGFPPLATRQAEPAFTRRPMTSLAALRSRFVRDDAGSVGLVFALMVIPCVMLVGFAVDFSRVVAVRQQTQGMLDNAALAGAKATQGGAGADVDATAQAAAEKFWTAHVDQIKNSLPTATSVAYESNGARTELTWTVTQWVKTPFLFAGSILSNKPAPTGAPSGCNASAWQCQKIDVRSTSLVQAGGSNQDKNIEISLMMDVTGSMEGSKITDLKLAAKDLVDIVIWNDQSQVTSKVGLAPFADGFNVGTTMAPLVRGPVQSGTSPLDNNNGNYEFFNFTKTGGSGTRTYKVSNACVTERVGAEAYTDAAPSSAPVGKSYPASDGKCSLTDSNDPEVNLLTPLSNDKAELKQRIDKLKLAGSTAGQLGTAWAWYLLSPNFGYLYPSTSQPASYSSTNTRKIAVIMTDGEYNTQFWQGVKDKESYDGRSNYLADNGTGSAPPKTDPLAPTLNSLSSSEYQAVKLCYGMKQKNIEVFAVGFQTSNRAKNLLKNCASDLGHFYDATTGDALRMAFRDIALKVSRIRIQR